MNEKIDWNKIGLRVGLEIHQQLNTTKKLFCNCPTSEIESDEDLFIRRLRPTRSELGEVDIAAFFEWKKGRTYVYHAKRTNTCLVEADEEPPHELNKEAVLIGLGISKALNSIPVDEIHVMRKIVIDGSNTSGFQRTALIALGGGISVGDKKIGIQTICIEEDASRKIREEETETHYGLERLGIPLIEISTSPDINTPEEAVEVARKIGLLMRLTGKVKRGIGTIRQDLNISIRGGTKIEVKGVQELGLLAKVIENEAIRQLRLLKLKEELHKRGIKENDFEPNPIDISEVMRESKSKIVQKLLKKKGAKAILQKLPNMKGLIGIELQPGKRFGTELADYAKFWGGVKGLFHSDELPGYGIDEETVNKIREKALLKDTDGFIIIIDVEEKAIEAIKAVLNRVKEALKGIPKETRMAEPDGTTRFMRPQPGAARMYPETDIPLIKITQEVLKEAEKFVPMDPEEKLEIYVKEYKLNRQLASQMLFDEKMPLFEQLVQMYKNIEPKTIASTLTGTLKALKREGYPIERLNDKHYIEIFRLLSSNKISKEAIEEIIKEASLNPTEDIEKLAEKKGLIMMSQEEMEKIIDKIVKENIQVITERKEKAIGILMGKAMGILRGKAPGKTVNEILTRKIKEILSQE